MRRARTMIARLRADRAGAAALEMAIILPVVGTMVMVAMEFSNAWMMRLRLEQAAQRGVELIQARKGVAGNYDYAVTEMTTAWGRTYNSATSDSWLECGGVRQASLTANCNGAQIARYVKLRITATYVPTLGWGRVIGAAGSGASANVLVGDAVVRVQ